MMSKITETLRDLSAPTSQRVTQRGFPVTRYPVPVKKNLDLMVDWKIEDKKLGFGLAAKKEAHGDCLVHWQATINRIMPHRSFVMPKQTVVISMATGIEFAIGRAPQEFVLRDNQKMKDGSFFTFKMITKHAQATYYNEDGEVYLAGMTYYPQLVNSTAIDPAFDEAAVALEQLKHRDYKEPEDRFERDNYKKSKKYFRYCTTAKEKVIVEVQKNGDPMHLMYNYITKKPQRVRCEECVEELKTYKAEQEEKKKVAALQKMTVVRSTTAKVEKPDSDEEEYDFGN